MNGAVADFQLRPVGVVRSAVSDIRLMPIGGVAAAVEVLQEYEEALLDIESNTHLIVLGWFHLAERQRLRVSGHSPTPDLPERGVFGLRSSDRPNPIGLNVARLLRVDGRRLSFDRLDMVDGTPVIDLKRYAPGWDCIFSARTTRERRPLLGARETLKADLVLEAVHFHGEACPAVERAAEMALQVAERWRVNPKTPELRLVVGTDGCLADCLQAICAATFGQGRLAARGADECRFEFGGRQLVFSQDGRLLAETPPGAAEARV